MNHVVLPSAVGLVHEHEAKLLTVHSDLATALVLRKFYPFADVVLLTGSEAARSIVLNGLVTSSEFARSERVGNIPCMLRV